MPESRSDRSSFRTLTGTWQLSVLSAMEQANRHVAFQTVAKLLPPVRCPLKYGMIGMFHWTRKASSKRSAEGERAGDAIAMPTRNCKDCI